MPVRFLLGTLRMTGSFILLLVFAYAVMRWRWRNRGVSPVAEHATVRVNPRQRARNGTLA